MADKSRVEMLLAVTEFLNDDFARAAATYIWLSRLAWSLRPNGFMCGAYQHAPGVQYVTRRYVGFGERKQRLPLSNVTLSAKGASNMMFWEKAKAAALPPRGAEGLCLRRFGGGAARRGQPQLLVPLRRQDRRL